MSESLRCKENGIRPNFFIVGAAKSGTTSLANYLSQHPDIYMPTIKEPKFFSVSDNTFPHKGRGDSMVDNNVIKERCTYEMLFKPGSGCKARGEASVDYLYFPTVAKKIKEYNPESNIIILLRNPVERAFSAYMHMVRDVREDLSFEDALEAEPYRKSMNWEFFWYYSDLGFYSSQVKRYLEHFSRRQVHIILFESLKENPLKVIQRIYRLVGVDASFVPDISIKYNISGVPKKKWLHNIITQPNAIKSSIKLFFPTSFRRTLSRKLVQANLSKVEIRHQTKKLLVELYREDIFNLQKSVHLDLTHWLNCDQEID